MKLIENVKAIKYSNNSYEEVIEKIVKDKKIIIEINDEIIKKFSMIEDSVEEFIVGYLFGENIITSLDEIKQMKITNNKISLKIINKSIKKEEEDKKETVNFQITKVELISKMNELTSQARIWQATGGTHVAGIIYKNNFIVREDVSRHVAVDKVIGYGVLNNFEFEKSYIIYSGRMPGDMVKKLVNLNIPLLVSNAAPMASGVKIAKDKNITLVGFLRGEHFNVYSYPERILF